MSTVSLNKVGVTKVAGLLVLAAVAIAFLAFPLTTNAMCGKTKVATTLSGGLGVADKAVTKLGTTFTLSGVFLDQAGNPVSCTGSATGWCIGTVAGTSSPVSFLPFATGKITSLAPGEWVGIVPPVAKRW